MYMVYYISGYSFVGKEQKKDYMFLVTTSVLYILSSMAMEQNDMAYFEFTIAVTSWSINL